MGNEPKHTGKASQECLKTNKWDIFQLPSQSPDLMSVAADLQSSSWTEDQQQQAHLIDL